LYKNKNKWCIDTISEKHGDCLTSTRK